MNEVQNTTPHALVHFPALDDRGRDAVVFCLAVRHRLERRTDGSVSLYQGEPQAPSLSDDYEGDPCETPVMRPGHLVVAKAGTDVWIRGEAHAPAGTEVSRMRVSAVVGRRSHAMEVFGDRVWVSSAGSAVASDPLPFRSMGLGYDRAFGGPSDPRNPIGAGAYADAKDALSKPLANLERIDTPVRTADDRPEPVGFGPIAPYSAQRLRFAGTYDEHWRRERMPLPPADHDLRFYSSGPSELASGAPLSGGEPVLLSGLHPAGDLAFTLPTLGFRVRISARGTEECAMRLDTVEIDLLSGALSMFYRGSFSLPGGFVTFKKAWVSH